MKTVSIRRVFFLFLGVLAVVFPTAPISSFPTLIETPDYLVCIIFVWLICEPKSAPFGSIMFLTLLADIFWQRPLGLSPIFVIFLPIAMVNIWSISKDNTEFSSLSH